MADYGFSEKGFVPKRLADIQADLLDRISTIQDEKGETPFQNASDDSIINQLVGIFSGALSECWGAAYDAFIQFDPLYNTGAGQSATVQLNGLTRKEGKATVVSITCTGSNGTTIPEGSLIGNFDGTVLFVTDSVMNIGALGTVTGTASCIDKGPVTVDNNSLNFIKSPVVGWATVTNTATLSIGMDEESDAELRLRQQVSTEATSYRQVEAIYSAIVALEGVKYARVYVNATDTTDARGIPAKEIGPVVVGGDDDEIAKAIFLRAPISVQGYGSTSVTLFDNQGFPYVISFSRPTDIPVYVRMTCTKTSEALPTTYDSEIKAAIVDYADYSNEATRGFYPGEDVYASRLYTPVNTVPGFQINSLEISDDGVTWVSTSLSINFNEVATFDPDNITITMNV